jgi:hypothetical protein
LYYESSANLFKEEKKKLKINEDEILTMLKLNEPLRNELFIYLNGRMLQNCSILDEFKLEFLSCLTFCLDIEHFFVGDVIFEVIFLHFSFKL